MMRLGIISDIHADKAALEQALYLLVKHGVHKIVCLGDVVEKGTDSDGCIQILQDWHIPCVMGNHDEMATLNQADVGDNPYWQPLLADSLVYLRALPLTRYYVWENRRLLLCHGVPTNPRHYLFDDLTPPKVFKEIAAANDADIILCGHTHIPMDIAYNGVRFLNAGSVCGTYSEGSRTCGILHLPDGKFEVLSLPPENV